MVMWKLKSCTRCGGDIFLDRDLDNIWYEHCLQCSYRHELKKIAEFKEELVQKEKEPVLVGRTSLKKRTTP